MHRILAIIERDIRRFRRSPLLIFASLVLPLTQLLVLGYAFGGKITNLKVGVVDQDHGIPGIKLRELFGAVAANARTFQTLEYNDLHQAMTDLREGRLNGVLNIPPNFSRKVHAQDAPQVALIEDDTDQFSGSTLEGSMSSLLGAYDQDSRPARLDAQATLAIVEVYPYIPYIQFLLAGSISLAIFITAMIGGGIIYIDDKARGLHEGYLVTPITKFELIMGFNLAGTVKGILAGLVLTIAGSLIAGIPNPLDPFRLARLLLVIICASFAFISMMFLMMVRISDPLVPRAIFGVLNTLLFFPSGAIYPTNAFPPWMKVITVVDPFTYAVHAFKSLLLKNTGTMAIAGDLIYLSIFSIVMMSCATFLFRRTL
jgi:ABC-2 type transport system permease protein